MKKTLAIILVVAMIVSIIPMSVSAAVGVTVTLPGGGGAPMVLPAIPANNVAVTGTLYVNDVAVGTARGINQGGQAVLDAPGLVWTNVTVSDGDTLKVVLSATGYTSSTSTYPVVGTVANGATIDLTTLGDTTAMGTPATAVLCVTVYDAISSVS